MDHVKTVDRILVEDKVVLVRGDLDVEDSDNPRTDSVKHVVEHLLHRGARHIRVVGHRETNYPICEYLRAQYPTVEFDDTLRANPGEKANDEQFAQTLIDGVDVYVNEAFATSHRAHASIVAVPKLMQQQQKPVCVGMRFGKEVEMLGQVWSHPGRRILVIGGTKVEDKEKFAELMRDKFVTILKGGLLPGVELRADKLDISDRAIEQYKQVISEAEVVLAAGVMGKYEDKASAKGTREVLQAIADNTRAYKVAGGGDIETAIGTYGLSEKFDWISVGGGAMLVFLQTGTLVGLQAQQ